MIEYVRVEAGDNLKKIKKLFREYEEFLGFELCFQDFENELKNLPGKYAPPEGRLIMARVDGDIAGCVALKKIAEGICEMKRLYVRPEFRGQKLGRKLAEYIISEAMEIGYDKMRLDTLQRLKPALELYRSLGFHEISAYVHNPLEDVVYMEKVLR